MPGRTRHNITGRQSGPRWFNNDPTVLIGAGNIPTDYNNCDDVTGHGDCAPFLVERFSSTGGIINLTQTGINQACFSNYLCDNMRSPSNFGHASVPGIPSDFAAATSAAARTNPSRSYSDVPANLIDMRYALESIKNAGLRTIDAVYNAGSRWLYHSFVIRPLVSDIVRMANAHDQINRRIIDINRMYDGTGKGYRKTVTTGSGSAQGYSNHVLQSAGLFVNVPVRWSTMVLQKVHIRWAPAVRGPTPSPHQVAAWARRSVQGGTIDFATLWEAVPWSWMIDWFVNTSDYLMAHRNIVPARILGIYPMTHTKTWNEFPGIPLSNGGSITAGRTVRETKRRSTAVVSLDAHFDILSGSQLGILAALAATRR